MSMAYIHELDNEEYILVTIGYSYKTRFTTYYHARLVRRLLVALTVFVFRNFSSKPNFMMESSGGMTPTRSDRLIYVMTHLSHARRTGQYPVNLYA
jgi:hypothetical protein